MPARSLLVVLVASHNRDDAEARETHDSNHLGQGNPNSMTHRAAGVQIEAAADARPFILPTSKVRP